MFLKKTSQGTALTSGWPSCSWALTASTSQHSSRISNKGPVNYSHESCAMQIFVIIEVDALDSKRDDLYKKCQSFETSPNNFNSAI